MQSVTKSRTFSTPKSRLRAILNNEHPSLNDQIGLALSAMQAAGLPFTELDINTGKFKRDRKQSKFWYIANTYTTRDGRECLSVSAGDASIAGGVDQSTFTWSFHKDCVSAPTLSSEEQQHIQSQQEAAKAQARQVIEQEQAAAAQKARELISHAKPLGNTRFQYLADKGLSAPDLPYLDGQLLIPYQDIHGQVQTVQRYDAQGSRRNLEGGTYRACFFPLGDWQAEDVVLLAEGLTTAITLQQVTETPVLCCLAAGNLQHVAQAVQAQHPDKQMIICGDNDQWGERNTGLEAAQKAARAANCRFVVPDFTGLDQGGKPTDFDDLRQLAGGDVVLQQITQDVSDKQPDPGATRQIRSINIGDFLRKEYPPRKNLLDPWLQTPGLGMVYAWRGVGKTHFTLRVAYAVASGGQFLNWVAPEPRPVLYIDGEMPAVVMQERLMQIVSSYDKEPPPDYFNLITLDEQGGTGIPSLATEAGQAAIKPHTDKAKLIIVDNISTLARAGDENGSDDWLPVQQWCLRMRSEGRTVLLVHHEGKGGAQRGTSSREDVLDTVIRLKRPSDYEEHEGARFEVRFEKARGLFGDDVKPFEVHLQPTDGDTEQWNIRTIEASTYDKVVELAGLGLSQADIAREMGINKSNVSRAYRKGLAAGDIRSEGKGKGGAA